MAGPGDQEGVDRRFVSTLAVMSALAAGVGASGCTQAASRPAAQGPLHRRPQPRIALAHDGSACLVFDDEAPANEVRLIDFASDDQTTFVHPDPSKGLLEGCFSPVGETLAVVAATPTRQGPYTGVSELLLLDRKGRVQRTLNDTLYFREPAFAPDGARLACFRDVTGSSSSTGRPDQAPTEREFRGLALFERVLETNVERRLDSQAFTGGPALSYGQNSDEIWLWAGEPLALIDGPPDNGVWVSSDAARATGPGAPFDRCALWRRGQAITYPLLSLADERSIGNLALVGYSVAGALLTNWRAEGEGGISELYLLKDGRLERIWTGLPDVPSLVHAISRDGSVIAIGDRGALQRERPPLKMTLVQKAVDGRWISRAETLRSNTRRSVLEI